MKKTAYLLALFLFFSACEEEEKLPDYLLSEERFTEVLTEVQIAESIVRLGYHRYPDSLYRNDSIYGAAFRKMEISQAIFDSNMNYYLDHPKQLAKIYDQVLINLSTRTAELKAKQVPLLEDLPKETP
ncbi:MAG: DUF4296 domain-containing protein [Bacteroidetes bacterium]|nr:MAG: DUF4296 domain-containing protein [Bacteroidota bacterium]MBL1143547.1 DUF4296 domain-containing protein [Bacteroidota bacterium]MCB0801953.1 DUF4296 domain-containing protein [Flavobacteriales bacterium]NOG56349.1 DUF4296 domain-containing protein [Bacteroidota bacterium]